MMSWKSLMFRVPDKKLLSPQGDFKAQAPAGMMAMMIVKSPAPALQSDIWTSKRAGHPGEMVVGLKLIAQMFSSFDPH
jgi:hypothetical protein